jgi:hypothetical protein
MKVQRSVLLVSLLAGLSLTASACGPSISSQGTIATSVAMTVDAQNTQQAQLTPTSIVAPPSLAPLTTPAPLATKAPPTAPGTGSAQCTAGAALVSETVPDGAIFNPGAIFTKIWRIQNTGTCGWDSKWKIVYKSGDLMGGTPGGYPFPLAAAPGQTVDVPVIFTAPTAPGHYRGYWLLQSQWGTTFGDDSGNPYWVDIVVGGGTPANWKTPSPYDITAVTYTITCRTTTANTFWHILINLSSNGPVKTTFSVVQSDGVRQNNINMTFTSATTQTFDYGEWSQRFTSSTNARWVQVISQAPFPHEWPPSPKFYLYCGTGP